MPWEIYQHLTLEDRCRLANLREQGYLKRQIATEMDLVQSTISQELSRNSSRKDGYKLVYADEQAWSRR